MLKFARKFKFKANTFFSQFHSFKLGIESLYSNTSLRLLLFAGLFFLCKCSNLLIGIAVSFSAVVEECLLIPLPHLFYLLDTTSPYTRGICTSIGGQQRMVCRSRAVYHQLQTYREKERTFSSSREE